MSYMIDILHLTALTLYNLATQRSCINYKKNKKNKVN